MSVRLLDPDAFSINIRKFLQRMGGVHRQPLPIGAETQFRFMINFRAPAEDIQQLLPESLQVDTIADGHEGLISMCVCDFLITHLAGIPIPTVPGNEILCRIGVKFWNAGKPYRAFYPIRSDSSSPLVAYSASRFSHYRKQLSQIKLEDLHTEFRAVCTSPDGLGNGQLLADMRSISTMVPESSIFNSSDKAADFILKLDGSCGWDFDQGKLVFQPIRYPEWKASFCHDVQFHSVFLEHVLDLYQIEAVFDSVLFLEDIRQTLQRSFYLKTDKPPTRKNEAVLPLQVPLFDKAAG